MSDWKWEATINGRPLGRFGSIAWAVGFIALLPGMWLLGIVTAVYLIARAIA